MKKKMCMAIVAILLLVGIPASGVFACTYNQSNIFTYSDGITYDGSITGIDKIEFSFEDVPAGTYLATLSDTTESSPGFLFLSLLMVAEPNTFLGYTDLINEESDSLSFELDTDSSLSLIVFGVSHFPISSQIQSLGFDTNAFTVQLSSVPVPATLLLLGSGLFALTALRRKNRC